MLICSEYTYVVSNFYRWYAWKLHTWHMQRNGAGQRRYMCISVVTCILPCKCLLFRCIVLEVFHLCPPPPPTSKSFPGLWCSIRVSGGIPAIWGTPPHLLYAKLLTEWSIWRDISICYLAHYMGEVPASHCDSFDEFNKIIGTFWKNYMLL